MITNRTISVIKSVLGGVSNLVYPPRCLICDQYGEPVICENCFASFAPISEPICEKCGRPSEIGAVCRVCAEADAAWGEWGWDSARAAAIYAGELRYALHRLKYRRAEPLGSALGAYLANRLVVDALWSDNAVLASVDAVAPLPARPEKEHVRGFNQAELLAAPVAEMLGVPLWGKADLKRRSRRQGASAKDAQVGLSGKERRANVSPADFIVADVNQVAGKSILLIDDVFTTGSTLHACAQSLKNAGAKSVLAATLAAGG